MRAYILIKKEGKTNIPTKKREREKKREKQALRSSCVFDFKYVLSCTFICPFINYFLLISRIFQAHHL